MDFLEEYVTLTDNGLAPERFRRWSGLFTIAAALDRNVWTSIRENIQLWPNLFIMLVAQPGVGKGMAMWPGRELLETQDHVALCPDSITHEAFIRALSEHAETSRITLPDGTVEGKSSMALALPEWGCFMREAKNDDMAMLANVFDCKDHNLVTIGRGENTCPNLYVNILACVTPAWFAEGFRSNDYEQGLPSRFIFVYSEEIPTGKRPPFVFGKLSDKPAASVTERLWPRLDRISRVRGEIEWSEEAGAALNQWQAADFAPAPGNPLLSGYCKRRNIHVAKIALLLAVSRRPDALTIRLTDFEDARSIMLEAEPEMSMALLAAGGNEYLHRMVTVLRFVESEYRKTKKPVDEYKVRARLNKLVPPQMVNTILREMIMARMLQVVEGEDQGKRKILPGVLQK